MSTRLRLRRADGRICLDRWGIEHKRLGGIFLHRMDGPDPGVDLNDHPWSFVSIILRGGYTEQRADTRDAVRFAQIAEPFETEPIEHYGAPPRGLSVHRRPGTARVMRLDEAHRITHLPNGSSWSLIIHGPTRRRWGFYLPSGWMRWDEYERIPLGMRREMAVEITNVADEQHRTTRRRRAAAGEES